MNIKSINKPWRVGLTSTGMLALLAVAMLCPMTSNKVQAVTCTEDDTAGCAASSAETRASVNVAPTIAVALQDAVEIDVNPSKTGSFAVTTTNLSVSTNNNTGYSVYLKTSNGENTLASTKGDNTATIAPVASTVTEASFENNTWGYNFGDNVSSTTTYKAVPTTQTTLTSTEEPADTQYNLNFATKVDTTLPSDTYSNTIIVSAVANPQRVAGLLGITKMQQMTSTICGESEVNDTRQLIDTRDNKSYWVAKLKDGNCWMTQNLALDITTAGLSASDTDITADWNSSSAYPPTNGLQIGQAGNGNTGTSYWKVGNYQLTELYDTYDNDGTRYKTEGCDENNIDISVCVENNILTTNIINAHYTLGNYYSWIATTAGTGVNTVAGGDAKGSICPKGWRLPTNYSHENGDFANLVDTYNLNIDEGGNNTYTSAPVYFTTSGVITNNTGKLSGLGGTTNWPGGNYWSSTRSAYDGLIAVSLYFYFHDIMTIDKNSQTQSGYSVRCVAR